MKKSLVYVFGFLASFFGSIPIFADSAISMPYNQFQEEANISISNFLDYLDNSNISNSSIISKLTNEKSIYLKVKGYSIYKESLKGVVDAYTIALDSAIIKVKNRTTTPPLGSPTVYSPNGGESLGVGSVKRISWKDISLNLGVCVDMVGGCTTTDNSSGKIAYDIFLVDSSGIQELVIQTIASKIYNSTYDWLVINPQVSFGRYKIKVCQSGTSNCDSSNASFKITVVAPKITSVTPSSGPVGTKVSLKGVGFVSKNEIYLDGKYILTQNNTSPTVSSNMEMPSNPDRKIQVISFDIPPYFPQNCTGSGVIACSDSITSVKPGTHKISVKNTNGTSNSLSFKVTEGANSKLEFVGLKDVYGTSEMVEISVKNVGTTDKLLNVGVGCGLGYFGTSITDAANGKRIQYNNPSSLCGTPPTVIVLRPGETKFLGNWNQTEWIKEEPQDSLESLQRNVAPGTYTISVFGIAKKIVIISKVKKFEIIAPASTRVNEAIDVTVKAVDQDGRVVNGYRGSIIFIPNNFGDTVPSPGSSIAFTAQDNGVKKFSKGIIFKSSGKQSISVVDVKEDISGEYFVNVETGILIPPRISSITPSSGPVGTKVSLKGTGFASKNEIYLDGKLIVQEGSAQNPIPSVISFEIPAFFPQDCGGTPYVSCTQSISLIKPGNHTISIKNSDGESNSMSFNVKEGVVISIPGTPIITSPSNLTLLQSESQTQTIRWNAVSDVTTYKILIDNGLSSRSIGNTTSYGFNVKAGLPTLLSQVGTHKLQVQACNEFNCSEFSSPVTIIIKPVPISISSPNGGEVLRSGEVLKIEWSTVGIDASNNSIGINVYPKSKGPQFSILSTNSTNLVENGMVKNEGRYNWIIPARVDTREDYMVYISTPTGWATSNTFTIVNGGTDIYIDDPVPYY